MNQRILVVDDYDAGRYAVGRVLRLAGFEISEAANGLEALQRAPVGVRDTICAVQPCGDEQVWE